MRYSWSSRETWMEVNYKYQKQFWWSKKYKPDYFPLCNKSQRQTQCFWGRLLYQEIWQPLAAVRWYLAEESRQVSATSWPSALFSIHYCCITTQAWLKLQQCWQNLYIVVPQEQCDWWQKLSEWRSLKVSWQDVAKNKRITLHSSTKDMVAFCHLCNMQLSQFISMKIYKTSVTPSSQTSTKKEHKSSHVHLNIISSLQGFVNMYFEMFWGSVPLLKFQTSQLWN